MCSDLAIKVEALNKCFQIYDKPSDRLRQMLARGRKKYHREFWAVKNVSFSVSRGETVGIVGRNGSGKSTLLQMICGTLTPTSGVIETHGRVAALLELGSGFNPEFSGRENVYLNGAILGLDSAEVDSRLQDILDFADIGSFIEQPVKSYSSGMLIRLAFAVAINADPQILVVDEALAVGDELFQRKCFSRIETIKRAGATILFVSHSAGSIVDLCDRAILMESGEVLCVGIPKKVVGSYQRMLYAPVDKIDAVRAEIISADISPVQSAAVSVSAECQVLEWSGGGVGPSDVKAFFDPQFKSQSTIAYEPNGAFIETPQISTIAGEPVNSLIRGEDYIYSYAVKFSAAVHYVNFGMLIKTLQGTELGGAVSAAGVEQSLAYVESGSKLKAEFRFRCNLNPGTYFLNAGIVGERDGEETFLHRLLDAYLFRVLPVLNNTVTGVVDFNCVSRVVNSEEH